MTTSEEYDQLATYNLPDSLDKRSAVYARLSVAAAIREQTEQNKINALELITAIRGVSSMNPQWYP